MPGSAAYAERLRVPLRWWALGTMFWASLFVAILVATPLWVALAGGAVLLAAVIGLFLGYGAARVSVRDGVLSAGRARISVADLGPVQALDRETTRALAGREADARAYLLLRPYLHRSVRVDIADPRDPTPYWLVATRHPARLVSALGAARESLRAGGDAG
jgi:hypothetical protein